MCTWPGKNIFKETAYFPPLHTAIGRGQNCKFRAKLPGIPTNWMYEIGSFLCMFDQLPLYMDTRITEFLSLDKNLLIKLKSILFLWALKL